MNAINYVCDQIKQIMHEIKTRQTRILLYKWLIVIFLFVNQLMGWIVSLTQWIIQSPCTIYLRGDFSKFISDYFKTGKQAKCQETYIGCGFQESECIIFTRMSKYLIYQLWVQFFNALFFGINYKYKCLVERRSIYICNTISAFINFIGALQLIQIREDLLSLDQKYIPNQSLGQIFQAMTALQIITTIFQFSLFKEYNSEQIKQIMGMTMPNSTLNESVHSIRRRSTILRQ